jgi:hypothetical protein
MRSRAMKKDLMHFKTMAQVDVPQGRKGKHNQIISIILKDLDQLSEEDALKVPLADLVGTKEKIRSALESCNPESWA